MRALFLTLLLANLLLFGWQLWIVPPEVPAERPVRGGGEPELALVSADRRLGPAPEGAEGPASGVAAATTAAAMECLRIGPFADGAVAEAIGQRLQAQGIAVSQSSEEGQIWVGHWVQIENVATRAEADRIVARLSAGGLPDAYVLQAAGPTAISLGVFRSRERADKVVAEARRLGFKPVVTDRYRLGVQYWLLTRAAAGTRVPVAELTRETGQIVRSDTIPCSPAPSVGGTSPIH